MKIPLALLLCMTFLGLPFGGFEEKLSFLPPAYADPQNPPTKSAEGEEIPPDRSVGAKEVPRSDGGKDRIYYSIVTPEEENRAKKEEKEKEDKSWDMLRNIIIDQRTR